MRVAEKVRSVDVRRENNGAEADQSVARSPLLYCAYFAPCQIAAPVIMRCS